MLIYHNDSAMKTSSKTQEELVDSGGNEASCVVPPPSNPLDVPGKSQDGQSSVVVPLCLPTDENSLTPSSCLLRQQIEIFSTTIDDIVARHRRHRPIVVGAVAIRCIHCRHIPYGQRAKGAVIFPSSVEQMYQSARNFQRCVIS